MLVISDTKIKEQDLIKAVENPAAGAIATFNGVVRNNANGKEVVRMEYEAHKEMAGIILEKLAAETKANYSILDIAIQHRTGMLEIGESSVMIAVSSAHRKAAFEACRYAIDRLKETLPVWKKEYFKDGSAWVEGTAVKTNTT